MPNYGRNDKFRKRWRRTKPFKYVSFRRPRKGCSHCCHCENCRKRAASYILQCREDEANLQEEQEFYEGGEGGVAFDETLLDMPPAPAAGRNSL